MVAFFDPTRVEAISKRTSLEKPIHLRCKIKAYDRETGVGKLRSPELSRVLNFIVPIEKRKALLEKVLTAMQLNEVSGSFLGVIDASGEYTSLILLDLEPIAIGDDD